jgi:hypothetical protein
MTIASSCRVLILSLCVASVSLAGPGEKKEGEKKAATEKTDKVEKETEKPKPKGDVAIPDALTNAAKEMATEFETALKDPSGTFRDKSDYFAKSTEMFDQDAILTMLEKKHHKDPRVDAYVKWQLISAQKGQFDEAHTKRAIAVYTNKRPSPAPYPGTSPNEQAELANAIKGMKQTDVEAANAKWKEKLATHQRQYAPMLGYRDELYTRLPRNFETLHAAYEDALDRINRGYDASAFVKRVGQDLRSIAAGSKPVEIGKLATMVQYYSGKTGAVVSTDVIFDEKAKEVKWKTNPLSIDKKAADALYKDLVDMSKAGF